MGALAFLGSHRVNGVVGAAHRTDERDRVSDMHTLYPGSDRQQDQRHHVPPLAVRGQSRPHRPAGRRARRRVSWMTRRRWTALAPHAPTMRRCRSGWREVSRANKVALANDHRRAAAASGRSGRALRCSGQAHPRIQAPVAEHPRNGGAVRRRCAAIRRATGCHGSRSSPARPRRLPPRQVDHQADQRRRRAWSTTTRRCAAC